MEPAGDPLGITGDLGSNQGSQPASTDSPKPFDASLFDSSEDQSGFLFQESTENEAAQKQETSPSSEEPSIDGSSQIETAAGIVIEKPQEVSDDGYEDQPIGSPNSQLKWSGHFDSVSQPVNDPSIPEPLGTDLFKDEALTGDNLEGKEFFDSFTVGGEAGSFMTPPQSLGTIDDNVATKEKHEGQVDSIPQSLSVGQDLGFNLPSEGDATNQEKTAQDDSSVPPHRELFSTLSLEEDETSGQPDTQSIDLLDQSDPEIEATEDTQPSVELDQTSVPHSTSMTLLEQSKLSTGSDSLSSPSSPTKSSKDSTSRVIHTTGPHPLSPQSPPGVIPAQPEQLPLDTSPTSPAGVIHDTSPHQLTPQSPQETLQQSTVSSQEPEPPRTSIFSPIPMSPHSHPFSQGLSQEGEDPFAAALSISESDRRHDAWLPSEATQRVLASRLASLHGTEYVDRKQLTMPGVIADDPQGDPLKDLVYRYMGEAEATQRKALTVNQVTRDIDGLKRLLENGCLRAAADLTALLLNNYGQGKGQHGLPSKHSQESLQIWFTRIAVLIKLQQYTAAETELEAFGNMDQPDLYFEYYPDLYPGRKGSMVPFSFRVLHAELQQYTGKQQESLNRLYHIVGVCNKIINSLESGLSEFGTSIELTAENRKASLDLWRLREVRVLYSIGNCFLSIKDFNQAANVYESLCEKDTRNRGNLMSAIGRIYLQLGDLKSAEALFKRVEEHSKEESDAGAMSKVHMNNGFLSLAENQYSEAHQHFEKALEAQPENFLAINNIAVCLLYMGRLKEALTRLESMVQSNPEKYLDEALLFNLCTLYELESSRSGYKKQTLLGMVNKYKGDGFNVGCLKMM